MPPICTTSGGSGLEGSVMKCVLVKINDGLVGSTASNGRGSDFRSLCSSLHNNHEPQTVCRVLEKRSTNVFGTPRQNNKLETVAGLGTCPKNERSVYVTMGGGTTYMEGTRRTVAAYDTQSNSSTSATTASNIRGWWSSKISRILGWSNIISQLIRDELAM